MLQRCVSTIILVTVGCGPVALAGPTASYAPESFETLPDVTVCVVDRATESGLAGLLAKRGHDGSSLLMVDGQVVPLERVHDPASGNGYALHAGWFARDSISLDTGIYVRTGGERRIEASQIARVGDFQAVPIFASTGDQPPPDAVYVPTRPGCVFQAYVRIDLM